MAKFLGSYSPHFPLLHRLIRPILHLDNHSAAFQRLKTIPCTYIHLYSLARKAPITPEPLFVHESGYFVDK